MKIRYLIILSWSLMHSLFGQKAESESETRTSLGSECETNDLPNLTEVSVIRRIDIEFGQSSINTDLPNEIINVDFNKNRLKPKEGIRPGQIVSSQQEFQMVFERLNRASKSKQKSQLGKLPRKIYWKNQMGIVLDSYSSSDDLGRVTSSSLAILGFDHKRHKLILQRNSYFSGPCQGVESSMIKSRSHTNYYLAIIPKGPMQTEIRICHEGPDCSGIP